MESPHASVEIFTPFRAARLWITGTIVAANGILSTNALAIAETQMIIATITYRLPPLTLPINSAISFKTFVCSRPPTTTKSPMKNNSVL